MYFQFPPRGAKKHFKRHDDSLVIKNQLFIEKSKKIGVFSIFRYIEKSNIKISIIKKYRYLSIYRNSLAGSVDLSKITYLEIILTFHQHNF